MRYLALQELQATWAISESLISLKTEGVVHHTFATLKIAPRRL